MIIISENRKNRCIMEFLKKKKLLAKIVSYLLYFFQEEQYQIVGILEGQFIGQFKKMYENVPAKILISPGGSSIK